MFSYQANGHTRYFQLPKFSSSIEIGMFIIGISCSILIAMPMSFIFFSDFVIDFTSVDDGFFSVFQKITIFASVSFVVAFIQVLCIQCCSARQVKRIGYLFLTVGFLTAFLYLFVCLTTMDCIPRVFWLLSLDHYSQFDCKCWTLRIIFGYSEIFLKSEKN